LGPELFPRYHVVQAVIDGIESLDSDSLPEIAQLRWHLEVQTTLADSIFTKVSAGSIRSTQEQERRHLLGLLQSIDLKGAAATPQMPYRRVLDSDTVEASYAKLRAVWGLNQKNWHPIIAPDYPDSVLVVDDSAIWMLADERPGFMPTWLVGIASERIYELREYGPSAMIARSEFLPVYTGAEGFWFDDSLTWLAYASHESSVAFAGTIRSNIEREWPEAADFPWTPFGLDSKD
jgi:hypothetical protein